MKLFFFFWILFYIPLHAQIVINEVSSSNHYILQDEDGDYPDWIELYNPSEESVNLLNWGLSDSRSNQNWTFPDLTIPAKSYFLVFASGKDKKLISNEPTLNHWETVIFEDDEWSYFIGNSEPDLDWMKLNFNGTSWKKGMGGFGYGDNDDRTTVPDPTLSVFYRIEFNVSQANKIVNSILSMDYDDSFIAYLNGVEMARSNINGTDVKFNTLAVTDHEALIYAGSKPESFEINKELLQSVLKDGKNVLAIQIHNVSASSSDLSGRTWFHFGISTSEKLFRNNPSWFDGTVINGKSKNLHTDFKLKANEILVLYNSQGILQDSIRIDARFMNTRVRIPDGESWCLTDTPSPMQSNGIICRNNYSSKPQLNMKSGFYQSPINLLVVGSNCHYTLDGSDPDLTSPVYKNSIDIVKTSVVKLRCFEANLLPSEIVTASYFINQNSELPVLSISSAPRNLFNDGTNGPAVYDKARGFTQSEKTFCHLEYFDKNKALLFQENASLIPVGNYSLDFGQKSLQFVFDEDWGAVNEEVPSIFILDKPQLKSIHGFRIRNLDDDASSTRMRCVLANRMGNVTHAASGAYQNVAVYINGNYWGHYASREMLDKYFMRDNYAANPDSVNLIKTSYSIKPDYFPEEGSEKSFFELSDFIINSDLSKEKDYNSVVDKIDVENWVDYFINEIYNNNQDWFPSEYFNNTRLAECSNPKVKWKFILWDMGISQGNYASVYDDLLTNCLDNPKIPNRYSAMMKSLLRNEKFKIYFINRFADVLNEIWKNSKLIQMIDSNANELASEIQKNNYRWGSVDSLSWRSNIRALKQFHMQRPGIQLNQIQNYFKLVKQVELNLDVNPKGAGVIKISTIIPDSLPWKGIYFNGNPVQITAIANPGYQFTHWTANKVIKDSLSFTMQIDVANNALFKANFSGTPQMADLEFSEVNYNSDSTISSGDWVELHNLMNVDLDISDFTIHDNQIANSYKFPVGTMIKKNDYLVVCSDIEKFKLRHPLVKNFVGSVPFNLNNEGENIVVLDRAGSPVFSMSYSDTLDWPCAAAGNGRTLELKAARVNPNLPESWFDGCMGGSPGTAYKACVQNLIVSEINYKSSPAKDAGDWVELYNNSNDIINISDYQISDIRSNYYTIPSNTSLNVNEYLVIAQDITKFKSQFPKVQNLLGSTQFGFDGNGDVIRIYNNIGELLFSICYDDTDPFPKGADGRGYTLELKDYNGNVNDGNNWFQGCLGGSPGKIYDPSCGTTGINNSFYESVKIIPNPTHESFKIEMNREGEISQYSLINSIGCNVLSKNIEGVSRSEIVQTDNIPSGIYTLNFKVKDGTFSSVRILIVH